MIKDFVYDQHAKTIREWGSKHSFDLPIAELLPQLGLVVNDAACGFLYQTDSKLGWLEWVYANPNKSKEERKEALDLLFQEMERRAIILGFKCLFSAAAHQAYADVLHRQSFQLTDSSVKHFIKKIGEYIWR